jgi:hypothetical protein
LQAPLRFEVWQVPARVLQTALLHWLARAEQSWQATPPLPHWVVERLVTHAPAAVRQPEQTQVPLVQPAPEGHWTQSCAFLPHAETEVPEVQVPVEGLLQPPLQ